jgi:cytochrome c oxidase subunit IV
MKKPFWKFLFLTLILLTVNYEASACSGYKITLGNKTIFGSNEDAWRVTPHIWFENRVGAGTYGAAFTGSRFDGLNGYAPQSGMNEMGLAFERLVSYHPPKPGFANRKTIINPTNYLKDIIHRCKSVEEVQAYISQYDHSFFSDDVFIYVDKSGKYLIVEPYTLTIGNEPTYVIANFCPSITSAQKANNIDRYRNGKAFLKNSLDTTLEFCTALSDTMHVCRGKIGDGTLLSSIWDLKDGTVNLYFYHDYSKSVQFDLQAELRKGNHILAIDSLFPQNKEFELLRHYQIPKNNIFIGVFVVASMGFFLLSSLFFLIQYFRRKENKRYSSIQLLLFPMGLIMSYYMYVLCGPINVFYFPAPYKDPSSVLVSLSSYVPFLVALLILPFCIMNFKLFNEKSWSFWAKAIFTLNNLIYITLIGLFVYWGFYAL